MYPAVTMGRTVILSEETVSTLLEAHASLAAWYYELVRALQTSTPPSLPDEATRLAFLARVAQDFPEIAAVARSIKAPRVYVPPPPAFAAAPPAPAAAPAPEPPATTSAAVASAAAPTPAAPAPIAAPAPAAPVAAPAAAPPASAALAPPPLVVPGTVKYE